MDTRFRGRRLGRTLLPLVIAAACALPALAADDPPLTLDAAVALAVRNAPLLAADAARVDAAREDRVRAGRLPDPELGVGLDNLTATGGGAFDPLADAMTMQTIGIMQVIPSRAARSAQRASADAQVLAASAQRALAGVDVRRAAADAWISLWAAQRRVELLANLRAQANLAVDASRSRLAGATDGATDALAARAEAADLDIRIDAAQAGIEAAQATLRRWTGTDASVTDAPDFGELPVAPATLLAQLDRQAPLLQWPAREASAQAALDAARASKHPQWSVGVSYAKRFGSLPDMASVNFGMTLPLFAGNRQDRDIGARHAERDAVLAEHEDARRAQRAALEQTLAQWRGWTRQARRYHDDVLPLAADRSRVALAAYRGGGALQPWLDARRDEITARLNYADALAAWGRDWAALAYLIPAEQTP
ncbi:MAG: TolC family protein [Proteobacteria bacterium]|nr:TolC family protein [Pseudomonadota bacterium]